MKRFEIHVSHNTTIRFKNKAEFIRFITRVIPPAYRDPKQPPN